MAAKLSLPASRIIPNSSALVTPGAAVKSTSRSIRSASERSPAENWRDRGVRHPSATRHITTPKRSECATYPNTRTPSDPPISRLRVGVDELRSKPKRPKVSVRQLPRPDPIQLHQRTPLLLRPPCLLRNSPPCPVSLRRPPYPTCRIHSHTTLHRQASRHPTHRCLW